MEKEEYDLLIIGGGITGAGTALDASSRGMKVALVEMQDFAEGTSSRSTKLVHGGLRYLKQFEVKVVAEVGRERAVVYENGPHVTTPEWMLLPIYENGSLGKISSSIGLRVYDFLANVKKKERRKMLSRDEVLAKEPLLKKEGLMGGGYYVEYRTDDARLTIEVMKQAVNHGARAINYAKAEGFIYEGNKVVGAKVVDQLDGKEFVIHAKKIVNATGPWVDELREKDGSKSGKFLHITKGVHLVFDQSVFPLHQAIYFDHSDGRMLFAIPRDGKTYVGTTDTSYHSDLAHPRMTQEDRDYILDAIRYVFPSLNIKEEDVESSWAGVRPLIHEEGKSPSEISRKDEIWESQSGLITIAGGKLTGYRSMAEMIVDVVATKCKEEGYKIFSKCVTKSIPISGGSVGGAAKFESFLEKTVREGIMLGLNEEDAQFLARRYGSNTHHLYSIIKDIREQEGANHKDQLGQEEANPLNPILLAQLRYSIEHEMTVKPLDFFVRRTGALFFNRNWVVENKEQVISWMSKELDWNEEQRQKYTEELEKHLYEAVNPLT